MKPTHFYLETDGEVFLIRQGRTWTFPTRLAQVPCRFQPVALIPVGRHRVLYAKPTLCAHPVTWFHKDALIGRDDVAPLVRTAVNTTLPRSAAKVAIVEKGKVLLVRANRGVTKNIWNLPGGFMGYTETPEQSAVREVEEELGVRVKLGRLVGTYTETFPLSGGYMFSFIFEGKRLGKTLRPRSDEIAEVAWVPLRQAIHLTGNPFARRGLRDLLRRQHT